MALQRFGVTAWFQVLAVVVLGWLLTTGPGSMAVGGVPASARPAPGSRSQFTPP